MLNGNLKKMGEEGQSLWVWRLEEDMESNLAKGRGAPLLLGFFGGVVVAADTWAPLICKGTGPLGCPEACGQRRPEEPGPLASPPPNSAQH